MSAVAVSDGTSSLATLTAGPFRVSEVVFPPNRKLPWHAHPLGCIAIVADEVFADYELEAGAAARAGRVVERDDVLSFALGGLSKSVGLPQVKLGWMAIGGPDRLVADAL